ncbi:MAG TPA: hypothetical protein VNO50_01225 [Pyrinomonadaceae bacterium]|nr:hypothetical protein [Pyrinomonadaceae bacterium]
MSQLSTLLWLKWTLFRNSMRSSKAVAGRIATLLGIAAALVLALIVALSLGFGAYALTSPEIGFQTFRAGTSQRSAEIPSAEFIFFSVFAMCYLFWAVLPLTMGSTRQFDPGHLLLYPISLRRLFAIDLISEITSLQAIFAIPAILAIGVGAGLGNGNLTRAMLVALLAIGFGVVLSKWVSTSLGSLLRKKRTRGETLLALIGVVFGLGGALFGQIAPSIFRHVESIPALRWTPPGAIAFALSTDLREGGAAYLFAVAGLVAYTVILLVLTFWLARRAILGGGKRKRKRAALPLEKIDNYTGWEVPLVSTALSAIIEKELRYALRNAQVRMMAFMPLLLIVIRLINRRHLDGRGIEGGSLSADLITYGQPLMIAAGVLYVFLILSGLFCNQFAFESAGMRAFVLSPVDRKNILIGKNIATCVLALALSIALVAINHFLFHDVTRGALLFGGLSFLTFAAMICVMGNSLSIRFPKAMKFGKRSNVSGVTGVLLIPMIGVLMLLPLAAVAAGFVARSLLVEYVTLGFLAVISLGFYWLIIGSQGETLQRRELEVLEVVKSSDND